MSVNCVVHLDLKGAPYKVDYLGKVIEFMKTNGAWGVLIEWEDTFPYISDLIEIGSLGGCSRDGLYSHSDVESILHCIKNNGMEPIQLVQTIGHMEFVLKHGHYRRLRELPRSPAVLCPSRPESLMLVKNMIEQVLQAQRNPNYVHIGADEAWHMNICDDCQQRSQKHEQGAAALFLEHIKAVASFIKVKYPDIKILMWDDMIRKIPVDVLKAYDLGDLVEPVVWNYNVQETFQIDVRMWERYSFVFPRCWVGSAFKGANGSSQMICSSRRYASNQLAWRNELDTYEGEIKFAGIILTGWSRYDHYATLCELLPTALPSLATCLRMWSRVDGFTNESVIVESLEAGAWPGHELARGVQALAALRTRTLHYCDGDQVTTWLNPWQIEHDYTNPLQVEAIATTGKQLRGELCGVRRALAASLHARTGRRSAEEFLQTFLTPLERRLDDVIAKALARCDLPPGVSPKADKRRPCD